MIFIIHVSIDSYTHYPAFSYTVGQHCQTQRTRFFVVISSEKKSGVKVRFFIGVNQRTRTDFLSQTKHRTYLTIFYPSVIWRKRPDFLSELLCVTMAGKVPLLDYVTPIFYRTEVSAHGPNFCRKQLREKIRPIFYLTKSQGTQTDFHSNILSMTKNQSVLGITRMSAYQARRQFVPVFLMVFGMTWPGPEPMTYCMRCGHANQ